MKTRRNRTAASALSIAAVLSGLLAAAPSAAAGPSASITPVLGGLAAPRGIAFDGKGSMYIAESGVAGAGAAGLTHTGKVDKFARGATTPTWSTGFNSLYASEDPSAPPDVLGPAGLSAIGNGCMKNSHGVRNGCQVLMITGESTPGVLAATGSLQFWHLYILNVVSGTVVSSRAQKRAASSCSSSEIAITSRP